MADATASFSVTEVDSERRMIIRRGTLTINAGDYVSGGITLDLSAATNAGNNRAYGKFTRTPDFGRIINQAARYHLTLVPGTTLANWKVKVAFDGTGNDAPFNEHGVTAINAALTGDTLIKAEFHTQKGH